MQKSTIADLISLEIAVRCIFSAVYDDAPTHERLTGLAQAVVALVPIYRSLPQGGFSSLTENQLRDAVARDAGAVIEFRDGRPALADLFISATSLERAIAMLAEPRVNHVPLRA